jgi:hypothetical protein
MAFASAMVFVLRQQRSDADVDIAAALVDIDGRSVVQSSTAAQALSVKIVE